jgi:hypothetical protein
MLYNISKLFWRVLRHPRPYRATIADMLWRRKNPNIDYPSYRYCVETAAKLARSLGYPGITVVEFGVAGGNGLLALERHATATERIYGLTVDVVGFDSGLGLPETRDYRDLPYRFGQGFYPMDLDSLRNRLKRARLELGEISETLGHFSTSCRFPIGAVLVDLDYYSSTKSALRIFDIAPTLPRVPIYFDDLWLTTPFTGEWAAIEEYNAAHPMQKIAQTWALAHGESATLQVFEWHKFDHPDYCCLLASKGTQGVLPLKE